jgi:hypothetical protein
VRTTWGITEDQWEELRVSSVQDFAAGRRQDVINEVRDMMRRGRP